MDLIQFFEVLNGFDHIKVQKRLLKETNIVQLQGILEKKAFFHTSRANICRSVNLYFLNIFIPFWNELQHNLRSAGSVHCIKAGLDILKIFILIISNLFIFILS